MQIAEMVLKYIEALVWPAITASLAWLFKGELQRMFSRVTRLETPAGAMDFAAEARAVHEEAAEIEAPADNDGSGEEQPARAPRFSSVIDEAMEILDTSPDAAVLLGWRHVEVTYRRVLSGNYSLQDAPFVPVGTAIQRLSELGLPGTSSSLILRLSSMRNRVAHGDASVLPGAALDYLESCELVSRQLETLAPVWVSHQDLHAMAATEAH
ncbi:hypothetical protein [Streptomyces sp. NPDC001903]|uniref:hypothetical protein n=1 Tax=Streptomyces sp. NPDC001903 TaxID=3364622 RepID=UPI00367ECF76